MSDKFNFGDEVVKILPAIMKEFAKRQNMFSKGELTVPQIVILDLLLEHKQCMMSELAHALNVTMSAVTAIIDRMIELKLVKRERSQEDRRVVLVSILEKGKDMALQLNNERRECANELFGSLTESDKKEYIRILRKVYDNLSARAEKEKNNG